MVRTTKKTSGHGPWNLGIRGQNLGSDTSPIPDSNLGEPSGLTGRKHRSIGRPEIPAANAGHVVPNRGRTRTATEPSNERMAAPLTLLTPLPHGLPPWLVGFVEGALTENQTLTENGASQAAQAREVLLQRLVAAAQHYLNDEITVEEAAQLVGKHPETIRRAVRKGALPDGRANPRGHLRIRRGDLQALAAPAPARYDPVTDAQDIAKRRRPL